ncbi:MAG: hypothetical protein ACI9U2_004193 [Bradymonadia bacterium]|jgi:hypothetical protein
MSRPDPREIRRRPMARGAAAFAIREASSRSGAPKALFVGDTLDLHMLHALLETAEAMVEGASYAEAGGPTFSGTALIDLDLGSVPTQRRTPTAARRLARALRVDPRVGAIVEARAAAAMSSLLGARTPGAWRSKFSARADGLRVRLDVEMEARLHGDAQHDDEQHGEGLGLG